MNPETKTVRCAIYTRKSSEEGLEQDFNSLHAQREACAAYVASQASEGWQLLPDAYDDGGISGGTLERPALQQLLADIAAGQIDIVVVYKVDRLTRSLLDFAKLVEAFDKAGTSFVSITQSFNTTTSMGRLTLNMLLSFAQFEREVTAERIRDKLAASKAKGMWMGGMPPLGYKPDGRTLAIVEPHAAIVRDIYARYQVLGNVRLVDAQLRAEGVAVPKRKASTGRAFGGGPFSRGQLYALLKNPIYAGDIAHKGKISAGQHPPLIEREEWEAVQRRLVSQTKGQRRTKSAKRSALAGRICDSDGEPLLATHTTRGEQRYRYYVSKALHLGLSDTGMRLPAREVEQVVGEALASMLDDPLAVVERLQCDLDPSTLINLMEIAKSLAAGLRAGNAEIVPFVDRVAITENGVALSVSSAALGKALGLALPAHAPASLEWSSQVRLTRTGRVVRLVHASGASPSGTSSASSALPRLLVRAHAWWQELSAGQIDPTALAEREGVTVSWVIRVVRLAFLSPRVVEGILAGRLRPGLDSTDLLKADTISPDWEVQEKRLLIA
jgi:site-specific DNA recombinase